MNKPQVDDSKRLAFHTALAGLLNDIEALKKDEKNPFFKSSYIPLPKMLQAIKPLCRRHGFILTQPVEVGNTQAGLVNVVSSRLIHVETGLSEASQLSIPVIDDMQKLGGAITYGRRYTLSAVCALEERDDDGNTATGKAAPAKKRAVSAQDDF